MKHTFNNDIECLIMVNNGLLNLQSSLLNLAFISQLDKKTIPALIFKPGASGYVEDTKIKGN